MACWKWFDKALKEAGIQVNPKNRTRIDEVVHQYVGKQSSYGRCSAEWKTARVRLQSDAQLMEELVNRLRSVG
jgi:predicted Fe-Mo cluster-binding NifX family protein